MNNSEQKNDELQDMTQVFTDLYEAYYDRVFKYICYKINDHHMAEELCSDIFEKIIIKYNTFSKEKTSLDSWVFTIAKNTITDYYRKKSKLFNFSLDTLNDLISSKPSPDDLTLANEDKKYLFIALNKLNDKERSIISLKYGAGLKNTEIAQIMELSETNVNVIIHRSLKKLKKHLEKGGFKYE